MTLKQGFISQPGEVLCVNKFGEFGGRGIVIVGNVSEREQSYTVAIIFIKLLPVL